MAKLPASVTIGEFSARSGVAASALRFYETQGLITAERTQGWTAGNFSDFSPQVGSCWD